MNGDAASSPPFYEGELREKISQGDIFKLIPTVVIDQPLTVVREHTFPKFQSGLLGEEYDSLNQFPDGEKGERIATKCHLAFGVILTDDCEIDKEEKHRLFGLIRPFNTSQHEEDKTIIRNGGNRSYFHLAALNALVPEGYVDFRRITTVASSYLHDSKRVASLSDGARDDLSASLFMYLTRLEVDQEALAAFLASRERKA
jgi:hypothetical protein